MANITIHTNTSELVEFKVEHLTVPSTGKQFILVENDNISIYLSEATALALGVDLTLAVNKTRGGGECLEEF